MNMKSWQKLLQFLEEIGQRLRQLEMKADNSLYIFGDEEKYREQQLEKTNLLIALPDRACIMLAHLAPELRALVSQGLEEFAEEALMAKRVNSIFYMSVLLYPEKDDEEKSPKAFDIFVENVRRAAKGLDIP